MKFLNNMFVLGVLVIGSLVSSCEETQTSSYYEQSTVTTTDTIPEGTPKGMFLYLNKRNLINLANLMQENDWSNKKLLGIGVDQIRVKINEPKKDFNPEEINQISTSFSLGDGENTVVQMKHYTFKDQTYHINVNSELTSIESLDSNLDVQGGFSLKRTLDHALVVTTEIDIMAQLRNY